MPIAGPWLCVHGAIYLEKPIIQPLTVTFWLGGDICDDEDRLLSFSQLFLAMRFALSTLQTYYSSLALEPNYLDNRVLGFPFVHTYGSESFVYEERIAEDYTGKYIYIAKNQSGQRLIVKFTSRYNATAHRLLAEHDLAPALYYSGTEDREALKYGGRYMIVMEFVHGTEAQSALLPKHFNKVKTAITLLHSKNFVFGDLRPNNIIIRKDGDPALIDFDWCGEAGETRYPLTLNEDGIAWPEGVYPGSIMTKEHDLAMLANLELKFFV